jgi:tetratricopeptide (TPR) repeat protein
MTKGDLCYLQRDLTGAEDASQAAINPGIGLPEQMAEAYNALGIINFIKGDRDAAVTSFDEAQSADPGNADALYNLAFAAYMNHSVKQAMAFLQETMDHHPEDELAALLLNMILAESSATDKLEKSSDHRRIMIGPIFPAYTGTKRLGYDWILASALRQRFITENTNNNFDVSVLNCYRSEMDPSCLSKAFFPKHNILDYLRSQQADLALIGHLHLYRHVIYGHIKAVETDSGTILLQKELKSEGKNKIHYMLEQLNAVLAEAISSK